MNEKSEFRNLIEGIAGDMVDDVHTSAIARIEAYDPVLMKADLTILQTGDEIFDVPVGHLNVGEFIIRPPYKIGDKVVVVFAESSIDEVVSTGEQKESQAKEKHSITDAIVVSGLHTWETELPSEHENDLIIAKKDFSSKVVIKETGEVIVESDSNIFLGENAQDGVPLGDQLKEWLDNHVHDYHWTADGGSGSTSPPSTESPNPSEKVRVE